MISALDLRPLGEKPAIDHVAVDLETRLQEHLLQISVSGA